jgi:hypothetical protein
MWATLIWLASLFFELPRVDGVNPVATMDGQVYDRGYIEQWIRSCRQRRQAVTSPATGLTLVSTNLVELAFECVGVARGVSKVTKNAMWPTFCLACLFVFVTSSPTFQVSSRRFFGDVRRRVMSELRPLHHCEHSKNNCNNLCHERHHKQQQTTTRSCQGAPAQALSRK